jgi:hypothetical protein
MVVVLGGVAGMAGVVVVVCCVVVVRTVGSGVHALSAAALQNNVTARIVADSIAVVMA